MKKLTLISLISAISLFIILTISFVFFEIKSTKIKNDYENQIKELEQDNKDLNYRFEYLLEDELQMTNDSIMVVYPTKIKMGSEFDIHVNVSVGKTESNNPADNKDHDRYLQIYSSGTFIDPPYPYENDENIEELSSGLFYEGGVNNIFTFEDGNYKYNKLITVEEQSDKIQKNLSDVPTFGYTVHVKMTEEKIDFSKIKFGHFTISLTDKENLWGYKMSNGPCIRIAYFTRDGENLLLSSEYFRKDTSTYVETDADIAAAIAPKRLGYDECLFGGCLYSPTFTPVDVTKGTNVFRENEPAYKYFDKFDFENYHSGILFHNLDGNITELKNKLLVNFDLEEETYGSIIHCMESSNNIDKHIIGKTAVAKKNGCIYVSDELSEEELCNILGINYISIIETTKIKENEEKSTPKLKVNGYIKWTDAVGVTRNAKNQVVEIYDVGSSEYLLGTVTTNSNGFYSFSKNIIDGDTFNIRIKVVLGNSLYYIADENNNSYKISSDITYNVGNGTLTKSITSSQLSEDSDRLSIMTNLKYYADYANEVLGYYLPRVKIIYSNNDDGRYNNGTIYYDGSICMVDNIGHEYGHYFADCVGISNGSSVAGHTVFDLLCEAPGQNCASNHKAAWNEGFAEFFTAAANVTMGDSFLESQRLIESTQLYFSYIDLNELIDIFKIGAGNEIANAALLFNIADSIDNLLGDNISWGYNNTILFLINNEIQDLNEFLNAISVNNSLNDYMAISKILTDYNIAPRITNVSETLSGLRINWDPQGCENTPEGEFIIHIFDEDGEDLLLNAQTDNNYFIVPKNNWLVIKMLADNKVYISVESNNEFTTEKPYSEFHEIIID